MKWHCLLAAGTLLLPTAQSLPPKVQGLLWHSYTDYAAGDSTLSSLHVSSGACVTLADDSFYHAMNADYGCHPFDIVFMAIDRAGDEWDIYHYQALTKTYTNLTPQSGCRNEDPKYSPDGRYIVFKRGYWDAARDDFTYDLAELELATGAVTMLTADTNEESMPYYSTDGAWIYFSMTQNGVTGIHRLLRSTGEVEQVFAETGVTAYYPIVSEDGLYFSRWFSPENHNDAIALWRDGTTEFLPFCDPSWNTSDACPLGDGTLLYSSTQYGSYDLCYTDGTQTQLLTALQTDRQELGAACFTAAALEEQIRRTADVLVGRTETTWELDATGDGVVNGFDLALLKCYASH